MAHYLSHIDKPIIYYEYDQEIIVRHSLNVSNWGITGRGEISFARCYAEKQLSAFKVYWNAPKLFWRPSLRPDIYNVNTDNSMSNSIEWLRLTKSISEEKCIGKPEYPYNSAISRNCKCAVLGTGPSYEFFIEESDDFEVWIGANSIVFDNRFLKLKPPFGICVLDPFIFSNSDPSRKLVDRLIYFIRKTGCHLITIKNYAAYIQNNLPIDISDKCIYISTMGHDSLWGNSSVDINSMVVTCYGNVLTDLMLNVAHSLSNDIVVYGCDGVPPGKVFFEKNQEIADDDQEIYDHLGVGVDFSYYGSYINDHSIYTKYITEKLISLGSNVRIRAKSWNLGLAQLGPYNR